jgi:hypothetical protein
LFERKARLIERLADKKSEKKNVFNDPPESEGSIDKTKVRMRSIPGGVGHQIVFNTKTERDQLVQKQADDSEVMDREIADMHSKQDEHRKSASLVKLSS